MYITVDNVLCVIKDSLCLICEYDLYITACLLDKVAVVFNIVNTGELMLSVSEKFSVLFKCEHIAVGIYSSLVDLVEAYKLVSYFVRRI